MKKRILAMLLAIVMLIGMMPVGAFATEATDSTEPIVTETLSVETMEEKTEATSEANEVTEDTEVTEVSEPVEVMETVAVTETAAEYLSALKFTAGTGKTAAVYVLQPAFDPTVKEYTLIVPDSKTSVAVWATLAEGQSGTIKAVYTNTSNANKTVTVTSGKASGASLSSVLKAGFGGNTVTITVGGEEAYVVTIVRQATLSGLTLSCGDAYIPQMDPAFNADKTAYTARVLHDQVLTVTPKAKTASATVTINGAENTQITPTWTGLKSEVVIVVSGGETYPDVLATTYTVSLEQCATSMEILTPPTKTEYAAGDKFDPTGMTLKLTYSDGSTETIGKDDYTYAPDGALYPGTTEIEISFDGLTVRQPITMAAVFEGEGTLEVPYLIKTAEDLTTLSGLVSGGLDFAGIYFKMVNDITLPEGWVPLGTDKTAPFSGNFDGNNKLLTVPEGGLPLIGTPVGATLSNLNIYGSKIASYGVVNNYTQISADTKSIIVIENVTLKSGTQTLKSGFIGGYASGQDVVTIRNCTVESGVVIGYDKQQSNIGSFGGDYNGTIENCASSATVYGVNFVGGIVGGKGQTMGDFIVKGCTFDGTVVATGNYVGGIVGHGYTGTQWGISSAPNAPMVTIQNCACSGSITGADYVGGILGAESGIAQVWDNGIGYIQNNRFTGTVSGGSYVGGIIGYMRSLNKYTVITDNYYADTCGVIAGIGGVQYVDTNCQTHETVSGAIYFSTENGTTDCPTVQYCNWKKAHNRTDDPLGADAAKLCYTDVKGIALTALEIAVGGNAVENAAVQTLTPTFKGNTTEYSTPILDYVADKNNRFVWLKVTAPEGATVTAKCGSSNVTTLTSGEWGVVQVQGGYFWNPTYSGPLNPGEYNKVVLTLTKEGEADKVYTVTVPMQPDISNRSLNWKTNLSSALYVTKDTEGVSLSVEAQYKNRPLENTDVITYQWYSNTSASTEGGTAIEGATAAVYNPKVSELGTSYYYVVASCADLESITSAVIAVTVTEEAAPQSISIVCDYPYTIPNDWVKALGGVSFVAKVGETLVLKAVDENGKETPVAWPSSLGGGTLDQTTGSSAVYTISNTSYSYIQVTSLYDPSVQSEEKVIQVTDYSINQWNKTPSVTLSTDGQSFPKISTASGIDTYTIWQFTPSGENIAELITDLTKKSARIEFTAMRPGTIEASFDLDLNGDGVPDGNGQTDSATLTINGIAVEDAAGQLTKTYLEISTAAPNPTVQLKALSSTENPVFTWSSADETVATVDENGLVTAQGVGSVIISATDGTYTGGIKVVVTSAETPYFEQIDFVTTNTWGTGLSSASWKTATFKPTTLEYTGLALTKAAATTLTLKDTTLYNADKYTAVASYTDANGEAQSITINSGAVTELPNIPFETNTISITLTDKTDETRKTVYTFAITRPRDTGKTIANNGIVFIPDGREIWKDQYDGRTEGVMYVANEDGSFAQYQGVNSNRLYYRTYALNGLEAFALTLKGSSAYTHIRFSTDDGATWTYLGQTGASGVSTGKITIPEPAGEEHSVVKVMVQILDDATYAANVAAEKDGFADSEPKTYMLWVEQIPAPVVACDIETAVTDSGDWYPTFDKDRTSYRIVVAPEAAAPVLTFTVSEGAKVTIGETEQSPNEAGEYVLTLTESAQSILVASSDGMTTKTYSFGYSQREASSAANKVVDYLMVNSQYINGNAGGYGANPQQTLTGGLLSLGNFGGYVTFYLENGLTDNPNNAYGVDFYVNGNAFKDVSTGTGLGSMEPGQVWVSQDGSTWYALAGSEHYEASTIWNYSVTYTRTETGSTAWSDNYGNTHLSTHGRSFAWPNPEIYTMNDLAKQDSFTLTGILIPCVDGSIAGSDTFNAFSKGGRFGYVDLLPNGTSNPYLDNSDYSNESSGFDLAWAVDAAGNPVDVSGMSFHYVKVVTASNLMAGSANEKSTEVASIVRAADLGNAVGVTAAPSGVTISGGEDSKTISFEEGQQVYELDLGDMEYVSILVNGTAESDNIYVNNQWVSSGTAATGIKLSSGQRLVRIIVQNSEKEPVIYLLKLSRSTEAETLIDSVKITVDGAGRLAETNDGKVYTAQVGYRVDTIGITANVVSGAELTINGKAAEDAYTLEEGENTFTITAAKGGVTQTVTLVVTKEKTPESTGTITVYFTLLGDSKHGNNGTPHTLADGNLTTWIAKTAYEIDSPAAVVDLIELALKDKYSYVNSGGNYISSINGLSEFDNGPNSGWMYTINGYHSQQGIAEQQLKDGDTIVLHYSDDWTLENSQNTGSDDATVRNVEELIDAIGTVTLNSADEIAAARKAYDALTAEQKQKVGNYGVLTAAEKKYAQLKAADDEKKAKAVEDLIDAILPGSASFEDDVRAAQQAYNNLNADQKKLVENYYKLANYLKDLADEDDKKAAEAVEDLIDAIGDVTTDSEENIQVARDAYDKLNEEQKALVGNLTTLEAAEERLAELKAFAAIEDIYKTTGDYLASLGTPVPGSVGGEWMLIGLIRSGREIESADAYYDAAIQYIQENIDENGRLHRVKSTENSRMILALTAMGKDVTDVGGHNLLAGLNEMEYIQKQGINGPVWALLAFDSGNYPVPEGDVSRNALIQVILDAQLADGGWALTGTVSDPDITGMTLQALAPYYEANAEVKAALDEAVETLSRMQAADGSFGSIDGKSSESIAQVITGLAALGIDAHMDTRFIKNGTSALDALCAFYVEGGGFRHLMDGNLDGMATEQGYYALTAYFRMLDGKPALYNMTDVVDMGGDPAEEPAETLPVVTEPAPMEPVPADDGKGSFPWWLVIVIVVLAGAIVVLVVISKPKKRRR